MKLLYAEDERSLSEAVVDILAYHKFIVDAVKTCWQKHGDTIPKPIRTAFGSTFPICANGFLL